MSLFYHNGLSEQQIAWKFNNSYQSISNIIRKNTSSLKNILSVNRASVNTVRELGKPKMFEELSPLQATIYHMRIVEKYSFDRMGIALNMPLEEIMSVYLKINELSHKTKSYGAKRDYSHKKNTTAY